MENLSLVGRMWRYGVNESLEGEIKKGQGQMYGTGGGGINTCEEDHETMNRIGRKLGKWYCE